MSGLLRTAVLLAAGFQLGGCAAPTQHPAGTTELTSDIFQIVKFFPAQMWQRRRLDDVNPNGFVVTVYLISGKTQKGAFADGTIRVEMNVADYDDQRKKRYLPAHTWALDPDQAMPYRVKREGVLGWGYMLHLFWPDDVDVLGKEVSITLSYERSDGGTIRARPHHNRVPIYDTDAYRAQESDRTETQPSKKEG